LSFPVNEKLAGNVFLGKSPAPMQRALLLDMIAQNQYTVEMAINKITPDNGHWRLNDTTASAGFIYRHMGETMNMFGMFFGIPTNVANTTMGQGDTGQGEDIDASRSLLEQGYRMLLTYVENTPDSAWLDPIETPFFGTVSRVRLFSHILFHNSYHAGQVGLTLARAPH
jgi:uncharacterized damage-inducible protein DinB